MRRSAAGAALAVALAAGAGTATARADGGPVRPAGDRGPLLTQRLSDEAGTSRWAHPVVPALVRSAPSDAGRTVARLRLASQDGPLEVLPVLAAHVDDAGRTWLRVRVPGRPNGRTGWVPRTAMGPLRLVRTVLRVDRTTLRATLTRGDRVLWRSRVGVGTPSTPTPAGRFWVRNRIRGLAGNPIYGPYAFGTGGYSRLSDWPGGGEVGIHGTDEPDRIPGRPSHGCVRVPNAAIARLWRLLPVGTPVRIT